MTDPKHRPKGMAAMTPEERSAHSHKVHASRRAKGNACGLACVPPERRKEIARMGGLALSASGKRKVWTADQARTMAALPRKRLT